VFDGCCESGTEIEIEVWDWDRFTLDDRIGSVRVKLGALANDTRIDLIPQKSGYIIVRSIDFRGVAPAAQLSVVPAAQPTTVHNPARNVDCVVPGCSTEAELNDALIKVIKPFPLLMFASRDSYHSCLMICLC
jgi:hypothetical protein